MESLNTFPASFTKVHLTDPNAKSLVKGLIKEGKMFLFNDALNTCYLQLYGIGHMVKDHPDSERGNLLLPLHGLLFPIRGKG